MSLISFKSIKSLLSKGDSGKHKEDLFKEVLLLVLARATRADTNVSPIEVTEVIEALEQHTGENFTEGQVLTAASSEIFETQSLERTLANATGHLSETERATILSCLAGIIRSDTEIRYQEQEFFDHVASGLRARPFEIAGLVSD